MGKAYEQRAEVTELRLESIFGWVPRICLYTYRLGYRWAEQRAGVAVRKQAGRHPRSPAGWFVLFYVGLKPKSSRAGSRSPFAGWGGVGGVVPGTL